MRQVNVIYIMLKKVVKVVLLTPILVIVVYLLNFVSHNKNLIWKDEMSSLEQTNKNGANSERVFNKIEASVDIVDEQSLENVTVRSKNCPKFTFPKLLPSDSTWMPADENRFAFVFSAYHVKKNGHNKIVIIGARRNVKTKYDCQFWNRNNETSQGIDMNFVPATSQTLLESHGKR